MNRFACLLVKGLIILLNNSAPNLVALISFGHRAFSARFYSRSALSCIQPCSFGEVIKLTWSAGNLIIALKTFPVRESKSPLDFYFFLDVMRLSKKKKKKVLITLILFI